MASWRLKKGERKDWRKEAAGYRRDRVMERPDIHTMIKRDWLRA